MRSGPHLPVHPMVISFYNILCSSISVTERFLFLGKMMGGMVVRGSTCFGGPRYYNDGWFGGPGEHMFWWSEVL